MSKPFDDIPAVVIDFVRQTFGGANDKVSHTLSLHPAIHEESLDHILVAELTASPPAFFAAERIGIAIETHWLGGRRMYGRWEIADIALFITLRRQGSLAAQKVALLQTKRLYSKEVSVSELDVDDFVIGIGQLADRPEKQVAISRQRLFRFDKHCVYGAMHAGSDQTTNIDEYVRKYKIPVYYAFYNPTSLPLTNHYPLTAGFKRRLRNVIGCRVISSGCVHDSLKHINAGKTPSYSELELQSRLDPADKHSAHGWRLEKFVADEVLRCREGVIFNNLEDPNLRSLFYERSAPITAAISITVDFAAG